MRITAHKLAEILMRAKPDAEIKFWSADGEAADLLGVYDDVTEDDDEFNLVAEGADTVNFDFDPIFVDDGLPVVPEVVGAGDDGRGDAAWDYDALEYME